MRIVFHTHTSILGAILHSELPGADSFSMIAHCPKSTLHLGGLFIWNACVGGSLHLNCRRQISIGIAG
jgi:hypothetical protein